MNWSEYQQWESETQAEIAAAARRASVQGGQGVIIDSGHITVRPRGVLASPTQQRSQPILSIHSTVLIPDAAYTIQTQISRGDGALVGTPFALQLGLEEIPAPITVRFKALSDAGRYLFPVRITLTQYRQLAQDDDYREVRLKEYDVDLRRGAQERTFARAQQVNPTYTEIVRLTAVKRI
jgi:hypothetical protein